MNCNIYFTYYYQICGINKYVHLLGNVRRIWQIFDRFIWNIYAHTCAIYEISAINHLTRSTVYIIDISLKKSWLPYCKYRLQIKYVIWTYRPTIPAYISQHSLLPNVCQKQIYPSNFPIVRAVLAQDSWNNCSAEQARQPNHTQDSPIFFIQQNYVHKTKVLPPYVKFPCQRWYNTGNSTSS